ncbi:YIP1 family protein [Methanogenium organophilum]|uniref:Yip1 family protein n=1 Tax=Methanogenium organophilum TaxID=2199 RepID=A0A9X9T787_METOG|nr:Yip1 family protein [Methanogenium organophilum]WAI00176.1 Yip1 family protein [Methanogenium organophilum]
MTPSYCNRIRTCLFSFDQGFGEYRNESFKDAFVFYLILLFVFSVLLTIVIAAGAIVFGPALDIPNATLLFIIPGIFVFSLVGGVVSLFIGAAITHIFILFFNGTGGYTETVRAACYSMIPTLLIGWTLIGAFITPYWGMAIQVFALHEFHGISKLQAVLAVFIPVAIFVVCYYLFIIAMVFSSMIFLPA